MSIRTDTHLISEIERQSLPGEKQGTLLAAQANGTKIGKRSSQRPPRFPWCAHCATSDRSLLPGYTPIWGQNLGGLDAYKYCSTKSLPWQVRGGFCILTKRN